MVAENKKKTEELNARSEQARLMVKAWTKAKGEVLIPVEAAREIQLLLAAHEQNSRELLTQYTRAVHTARIDPVTGQANRAAFDEELERGLSEITVNPRSSKPRDVNTKLSVVYIDLNKFKPINDQYGHAAGDRHLKQFGLVTHQTIRPGDILARIGGDEFGVILKGGCQASEAMIGRLRKEYADEKNWTRYQKSRFPLMASIGYTECRPDDTVDSVLVRADAAMYEDKKGSPGARRPESLTQQLGLEMLNKADIKN